MSKTNKFLQSLLRPFSTRQGREAKRDEEDLEAIAAKEKKVFQYETLVTATRNFNPKHKLGEGGFGPVYKGRLEDGREVAVKRLGRGSRQGVKEFTNEAMLLSRVQHKNVVNLYGYCTHGDHKLLVYEYVPNESLDKLLFSQEGNKRKELDWKRRYDVMVGVARGLLYLHEDAHTPIIHRDIKASNILLDDRWTPKIADFGMARLFHEDLTHVNTRVAGTNGYMAPEYVMHGSLSTKADVFSFGVLVLELISGQKNSSFIPQSDAQCLLEWAWKLHRRGQSLEMMDVSLRNSAIVDQVTMCVHIGLLCTQSDPKLRPDMKRVVVILSKKPSALEEPMRPGIPGSRYRRRAQGTSYTTGESSSSTSANASRSNYNNTATMSTSPSTSTFASSSNANTSTHTRNSRPPSNVRSHTSLE
ncbi:hypothetical protein J5N97_009601 [Dioscorea zingiberensis]|uniref:Protein kinase domain-containing protein n=1 Tax=Dioscorea zingiberensis TaxID=325984 RepID=A0A9D5HM27_9LILI|nr:hypothetical protein J5N97_009601 [Dioscorea zingiberensis]